MNGASWSLFVMGAFLIIVAPGPDFLYVITQGMGRGRRLGVLSALGISLGLLTHTLLAAVGLTALLAASPIAFELVRYGGAAYLVYLGVRAFRSHGLVETDKQAVNAGNSLAVVRQGMLTNLLNPKALLTFLAFIPQFVNRESSNALQILLLGGTLALIAVAWFSLVGYFAGSIGNWVAQSRLARGFKWLTGSLLIGLGVRLVVA
ncbi:MAG TPA: LysE family translocator [Phototrophicaceae bacterium]|nr:LysE family translocator [Phototrophicaceae bacterium]